MSDQMEKSTAVQELDSSTTHEDLMPTPPEKRTITSVTFFAVSYTHLDVYKRQPFHRNIRKKRRNIPAGLR